MVHGLFITKFQPVAPVSFKHLAIYIMNSQAWVKYKCNDFDHANCRIGISKIEQHICESYGEYNNTKCAGMTVTFIAVHSGLPSILYKNTVCHWNSVVAKIHTHIILSRNSTQIMY